MNSSMVKCPVMLLHGIESITKNRTPVENVTIIGEVKEMLLKIGYLCGSVKIFLN